MALFIYFFYEMSRYPKTELSDLWAIFSKSYNLITSNLWILAKIYIEEWHGGLKGPQPFAGARRRSAEHHKLLDYSFHGLHENLK